MSNRNNIYSTLLHRTNTLIHLCQNIQQHRLLLPELLVKTIQDTYRFLNEGISHHNCSEICQILEIPCSSEEIEEIQKMELSLRKSKDYNEYTNNLNISIIISIANKWLSYLQTIKI